MTDDDEHDYRTALGKLREVYTLLAPKVAEYRRHPYKVKLGSVVCRVLVKVEQAQQILEVDVLDEPPVPRCGFSEDSSLKHGDSIVQTHESYGSISVSRVSGGMRLVGSMAHNLPNFIEIRVGRAQRVIDNRLHTEYFSGGGTPLITVRMSTYQWAELISSLNTTGVPCTISNVLGVTMDAVPEEAKTPLEQIAKNIQAEARTPDKTEAEFNAKITRLEQAIAELGLTKKKAAEISARIHDVKREVVAPKSAAEWAGRRMAEACEEAVSQAKVEIAAALTSLVQQAGVAHLEEHLRTQAPVMQLTEKKASSRVP